MWKKSIILPNRVVRFDGAFCCDLLSGRAQRESTDRVCIMEIFNLYRRWIVSLGLVILMLQIGCAQLQLPAFDPTGNRVFAPRPNSTQILTPCTSRGGCLGLNPLRSQSSAATGGVFQPAPLSPVVNAPVAPQFPVVPAFQHPADPPPCNQPTASQTKQVKHIVPHPSRFKTTGQKGQIIMTPSRIVAPVGSEVVVLAGICGGDGYFVINQPLEWMLSNDSAGEIIEVGGMNHSAFNQLVPPSSKKIDGKFARGRTGLKNLLLTRGTPTPVDDIELQKGQTYISVSSASPGTSYITGLAPKAEGWDRRRSSTVVHWVDAEWSIPVPASATAGTVFPLTTVISRTSTGGGVENWDVRYTIVGGAPAEFAPAGSQTAETKSDRDGRATAQIRQVAGQFAPGTTQVRVDVVRPPLFGEPELVVESGITSVTWSAPALTVRAIGPKTAEVNQAFNYRIEVTNPGDQVSRDVVVRTKNLADSIEFISSTPKPTEYGRVYEWSLGDIPPGSPPRVIEVQLKSQQRGSSGLCFEVASATDQLRTEACATTEVSAPCIGMNIDGPTTAQVGDDVVFNLNVQNQCDEPIEDIQVTIRHDQGLLRPGKSNPATFKFPILQFGETRTLPLTFNVQSPGTLCFEIEVTARGGHSPFRDRRCLEVGPGASSQISSQIDLIVEGGRPMEVGGESLVNLRVTNKGETPLENVVLTNRFSSSIEPISLSEGFNQPEWLGEEMAVFLGRINPGQTVNLDLLYQGKIVDGNAVSEFSVTTPSGAKATEKIQLQVERAGAAPNQPDSPDLGAGNGPIGIPQDAGPDQGELTITVRSPNQNIQMVDSPQRDPNAPQTSRIEFVVKNNRRTSLRDVDIRLLVSPNIKLTDFFNNDSNLDLEYRNDEFTEFYVRRCLELRPGEELKFAAVIEGVQPGLASFEVQAQSPDTTGTSVGRDTISVSQ